MKNILAVLVASLSVLGASLILLYGSIFLFPNVMAEYFNDVFRASSFETDWLFYAHPFVLSAALKWPWERYKELFAGSIFMRALEVGIVYAVVAMVPVLWLTFSAINVSFVMVLTWLVYGTIQATVAGLVYAKLSP
jgi:hypothetical protein